MQDCGENHSGRNCVVEQRSAANGVPQSICGDCAAAANVIRWNPLAGWDLRSAWSVELRWNLGGDAGGEQSSTAALLLCGTFLTSCAQPLSLLKWGFALQPLHATYVQT